MPISLVTGPANAGKAQVVMEALRAHLARGRQPLLVVPTAADQARHRRELGQGDGELGQGDRELGQGDGAPGARVERFQGLLALVVGRAGRGEAGLGELARQRMLASIAGQALGHEAHVRPGFAAALATLVAELEAQRVTPARLRRAVRAWRAAEGDSGGVCWGERLCAIFDAYHAALTAGKRADRELRVTRALDELRRNPALWRDTPVLLHGFDDLTELELDTIETLGAVVDAPVTVSLAYEPGRAALAGHAEAFHRLRPLAVAHTELPPRADHHAAQSRAALHHLERWLLVDGPPRVEPDGAVRLLEGASPRAELELVAGEVRALLDGGAGAEEIAIAHRSPEAITGLLGEVLDDFAVPHRLRACERFARTASGRALLGLARCAFAAHAQLGDLMAWLRAPGVLDRPELADELEAAALRRGATGAEQARRLREAERWPLDRIERLRAAAGRGPHALLDALQAELERLACSPGADTPEQAHAPDAAARALRQGTPEEVEAVDAATRAQGRDTPEEVEAVDAATRALEELRELARSSPGLFPGPRELIEVLEGLALGGAERPSTGCVLVSDPSSLRTRRVKALFLCGLQEGVFPAPAQPHPLLSGEERRRLAQASGLLLARERDPLAGERRLLYAICSRPEQLLALSWHTADEDGVPVAPSLFLDDVCDLFSERLREQTRRRHAGAVSWPGPGAPAGAMAVRDAAARAQAHGEAADRLGATPAGEVPQQAGEAFCDRRGGSLEAVLAPLGDERVLGELRERTLWSASSLESWAACPVRWFVERLLRAEALDGDREPIARGALAHAALRDTLERLRERTGSARLTPATVEQAKRLLGEAIDERCERQALSLAPERVPGAKRRLQADLERYLDRVAQSNSQLEPTYLELEFGFAEDGEGLPALELGEEVKVRGRIDRVDVAADGQAVVYDYKGRTAPAGARWASDGALQVGLYMQAVQSLLGHTPAGGFYQPLAGKDLRPRGLLDAGSGLELDCVRTDRRGHVEFQETLQECRQAALAAAAQARAGMLEPRPATCSHGGGCMYPTVCRCER